MPASSSTPKSSLRFGGACRWTSGGRISRAAATAQRYSSGGHGGASCIAVPGFGRKFWTITSCTWPWRACDCRDGLERGDDVGAVLADADEDPGRERDGELAGGLERGEPALGRLVGRAAVAVEVGIERLDHHPLRRADTARRRASSSANSAPALAWGSRPVSSSTSSHIAAR